MTESVIAGGSGGGGGDDTDNGGHSIQRHPGDLVSLLRRVALSIQPKESSRSATLAQRVKEYKNILLKLEKDKHLRDDERQRLR